MSLVPVAIIPLEIICVMLERTSNENSWILLTFLMPCMSFVFAAHLPLVFVALYLSYVWFQHCLLSFRLVVPTCRFVVSGLSFQRWRFVASICRVSLSFCRFSCRYNLSFPTGLSWRERCRDITDLPWGPQSPVLGRRLSGYSRFA